MTQLTQERLATPYNWQQSHWQRLGQQSQHHKLPHALLLSGPKGTGKHHFANALAYRLLCLSPITGEACGRCKGCGLNLSGTHPDLKILSPEGTSRFIKIDQVRQLTDFVSKTAQQGGKKLVIISPVEALNTNAANALLKNLEEPSGETVLLLVTHARSQVIATIRSRCQLVDFPIPAKHDSLSWLTPLAVGQDPEYLLNCSGGAPLKALQLLNSDILEQRQKLVTSLQGLAQQQISALDCAAGVQASEPITVIENIIQWLQLGVKGALAEKVETGSEDEDRLIALLAAVDTPVVFRFMDKLNNTKRQLLGSSNPNKLLVLEELMMDWSALTKQTEAHRQSRQRLVSGLV